MAIDFNRVPPRAVAPPPPQASMIVWTVLLVLAMGAGAGSIGTCLVDVPKQFDDPLSILYRFLLLNRKQDLFISFLVFMQID